MRRRHDDPSPSQRNPRPVEIGRYALPAGNHNPRPLHDGGHLWMNEYQQHILDHLVSMAQKDKAYAWWAAKNYAGIDPHQLADMPALLTARMKALQAAKEPKTGVSTNE